MPYVITPPSITLPDNKPLVFRSKGVLSAGVAGLVCQATAEDSNGNLHPTAEFTIEQVKNSLPSGDRAAFEAAMTLAFTAIAAYTMAQLQAVEQP